MHATMVTFLFDDMDAEAIANVQRERAALYDATPGLISKTFWVDPLANECGAFYAWESRASAEALFTREWQERVSAVYGAREMHIRALDVTARSGLERG